MRYLHLDAETIPTQSKKFPDAIAAEHVVSEAELAAVKADGRLKEENKAADIVAKREALIAKAAEKANDAWRATALDGWRGHIATLAWAFDDEPVVSMPLVHAQQSDDSAWHVDVQGERAGLEQFLRTVAAGVAVPNSIVEHEVCIVGHRVRSFDALYIWQRCIVLGVEVPNWLARLRFAPRYSTEWINDTNEMAGSTTGKPFAPSLDHVCAAIGIECKGDIDGSRVWDEIVSGRLNNVLAYNRNDVRRSRSIWRRMNGRPPLAIDTEGMEAA
ncbi:hypothetical protein [Rhodopseudomonas palustris]|uniref:hypothetical protein n=1 Tax=Rhodopseudomonas palustris TaxID=1076 RepID=UPI0021F26E8C|nr:hypothetical protein [Rhodopseudomonas palustris]UYO55193.1 hypothetical protein KQX61_07260 [Rhodopseudomonas palustris]